jgi:hypothetical protein
MQTNAFSRRDPRPSFAISVARMERSAIRDRRLKLLHRSRVSLRSTRATNRKQKKEAERRQTCSPTSAPYGRGAHRRQVYAVCANPSASGALACRRSAAALRGANQRPRSSPGALPETWLRNGRYPLPPIPVQRLGRRPVLMPAGLCPEPPECGVYRSARGAPHSLHLREYPRPKASFT